MFDTHSLLAQSTIQAGSSIIGSTTNGGAIVAAGDGAKFALSQNVIIWPNNTAPTKANAEIGRITAISTDTFTVTRAQEGTTALANIAAGYQIANVLTPKTLTDIEKRLLDYNVKAYGAVGDNTTDDTTAIQSALNAAHAAGGGIVTIPYGEYKLSAALTVYTGTTLRGVDEEGSILHQTSTTADGLTGTDIASVTLENLMLLGPNSGSGHGINFGWSAAGNLPYLNFRNIIVKQFGSDGLYLETPIVSHFDKVIAMQNGGSGFNLYHAGTSNTFTSCFANANTAYGYNFYQTVYTTLTGCAADGNGIGYLIDSAQGIALVGCGAEATIVGTYDGSGFKVTNSTAIGLYNCWNYDNRAYAFYVTGSSSGISFIGCAENSPHAGATASLRVDTGSAITHTNFHGVTAVSFAGAATQLDDGAGNISSPNNIKGKTLSSLGGNGQLTLTADTDASEYNLAASATGTLSLYGSAGATLHLNMFDGDFKTNGTTRLTNSGVLQNTDLTGAGNTFPTSLATVTGTQTLTNKTLSYPVIAGGGVQPGAPAGSTRYNSGTIKISDGSAEHAVITDDGTQTLTNKRLTQRVGTTASSATPSINADNYDQYNITALAANVTSFTISGSPSDGDSLIIRIKDNGTPRTLATPTNVTNSGIASFPTSTTGATTMTVGLRYDSAAAKWIVLAADATGY